MTEGVLIKNGDVVGPDRVFRATDLLIKGDKIAAVGKGLPASNLLNVQVLDAANHYVCPGFIDIHVHGARGALAEEGSLRALRTIAETLAQHGTTSFLPTLGAIPPEATFRALETLHTFLKNDPPGARVLGVHLEGPYLNPARRGAQVEAHLRKPDVGEVQELISASGEQLKLMTIAPELDGAMPVVRLLTARGITVAVGHSDATYDEMCAAVDAGLSHVAHTYNGMRPFHHREPGVLGAALTMRNLTVELICDGHHVSPTGVDITLRCKGPDRIVLISDAVAAMGMPNGNYTFFGMDCVVEGGTVRLKDYGNLAGSAIPLRVAVANVFNWFMDRAIDADRRLAGPAITLPEAVRMASLNPARVIGVDERKGSIEVGKDADVTVLDTIFRPVAVFVEGKEVLSQG